MNKSKKVIVATLAMTLAVAPAAYAAPEPMTAPAASTSAAASVLEQVVPVRTVAESLGARVTWNAEDQSVMIAKGATEIVLKIGESKAMVNGAEVSIGQAVELVNHKTVLPLSFINQALGAEVNWDADNGAIVISEDDLASAAAHFVYEMNQLGAAGVAELISPALAEALPAEKLATFALQYQQSFGSFNKQLSSTVEANGVHTNVTMMYETDLYPAPIQIILRFNEQGAVDDFNLSPASAPSQYSLPDYAQPELYTEQEVVIGEGAFALPGTLTVPIGEGPFPVAILVQGSGPHDQDSTIGSAKPFKDIATGLASQGIAVLRYEKITYTHTAKISADPMLTLYDESVADVFRAIELLKQTDKIDPEHIYVAGHSQGGYAVPKMIEADTAGDIAGAILMSAPSRNMSDVLIEQQQEVLERMQTLELPAEMVAQQEQAAAFYTGIAQMVQDPAYSKDNLPENFPLQPAYWWFEQRDYEPAEVAKEQTLPMLVLQGENDWQVTTAQYEHWQEVLAGRDNVEYRAYPSLNHLLTAYEGVSVGLEYQQPANVSADLVKDIAEWIKKFE